MVRLKIYDCITSEHNLNLKRQLFYIPLFCQHQALTKRMFGFNFGVMRVLKLLSARLLIYNVFFTRLRN